jgi:hypothetical protein
MSTAEKCIWPGCRWSFDKNFEPRNSQGDRLTQECNVLCFLAFIIPAQKEATMKLESNKPDQLRKVAFNSKGKIGKSGPTGNARKKSIILRTDSDFVRRFYRQHPHHGNRNRMCLMLLNHELHEITKFWLKTWIHMSFNSFIKSDSDEKCSDLFPRMRLCHLVGFVPMRFMAGIATEAMQEFSKTADKKAWGSFVASGATDPDSMLKKIFKDFEKWSRDDQLKFMVSNR